MRALKYADLKSLEVQKDTRPEGREIVVRLGGNMERFMWSFNGLKLSETDSPIATLNEGERVRFVMVNDTMMTHPIHLHGQFFEVVTGERDYKPRKHTINVKPGEKMAFDFTANAGDWAFHCHLLFHMHAGMMQVVSVLPGDGEPLRDHMGRLKDATRNSPDDNLKSKNANPSAKIKRAAPKSEPAKTMDRGGMDHGSMGHGSEPAKAPPPEKPHNMKSMDHDGHGGGR